MTKEEIGEQFEKEFGTRSDYFNHRLGLFMEMKRWIEDKFEQNSHKHGVSGKRHDLEWFLSHVGERVFRNKVKCDCESCKRGGDEGVFITDKTHAKYLFDVQNELGIRYHAACADTKGGENG